LAEARQLEARFTLDVDQILAPCKEFVNQCLGTHHNQGIPFTGGEFIDVPPTRAAAIDWGGMGCWYDEMHSERRGKAINTKRSTCMPMTSSPPPKRR
jgi:hypothetical protein